MFHAPDALIWNKICHSAGIHGMYASQGMTSQNPMQFYSKSMAPFPPRKVQSYAVDPCPGVQLHDSPPWKSPNRTYSAGLEG